MSKAYKDWLIGCVMFNAFLNIIWIISRWQVPSSDFF